MRDFFGTNKSTTVKMYRNDYQIMIWSFIPILFYIIVDIVRIRIKALIISM